MSDIQDLEKYIEEQQKLAHFGDAIDRLSANEDFRTVVTNGFLRDEAARFAALSDHPGLDDAGRADSLRMAQAAGHFKRWLVMQENIVNTARHNIAEATSQIEELRAEGSE